MAKILVVDDEAPLLRLLSIYLGRQGHEVVCCPTANEGLAAMESARFDAAVLDQWLPDMDGAQLISEVLSRDTAIRILVSSGSLMDLNSLGFEDASHLRLLQKPYAPKALVDAIEELLQRQT